MGKTVCKKKEKIETDTPKFICIKCGLTAKKEKHVCKPERIK